jgi:chitodextrinase
MTRDAARKALSVVGILWLGCFLRIPVSAAATVSVDFVGPGAAGVAAASATTLSWNHTVSGSNTLLTTGVAIGVNNDSRTVSVTYNGVPMTSAGKVHSYNRTDGFIELFYLVAPAAGTHPVQVTLTGGSAEIEAGSVSFVGVNQAAPVRNIVIAFGNSTAPSVTVASAPGNMVVDAVAFGTTISNSGKTSRWIRNQNGNTAGGNGAQSTAAGASSVTMGYTTSNMADWWAIIGMDIVAASDVADTSAPTRPANLAATPVSQSQINLAWTASTDNVGVAGYTVFRNGSQVGTTASTSYSDSGLAASTTYTYTVDAFDAAGLHSARSFSTSATTLSGSSGDTQAPSVSITLPTNGSTVTATTTVSATASDNVGVVGVQFLLDGMNLGSEDTTSPYSVSWNTVTATNGSHTVSARARDAAGRTTTSSVSVTVDNQAPVGTVVVNGGAAATDSTAVTLTLSATDALSSVTQMRFSNSNSFYSTAEAYAPTKAWTLTTGEGTKTVYVRYKDAVGNWSSGFSTTIVLDTTAPTISAVSSSNISANSATVAWTTNEPASSQVEFGLTTGYGTMTTPDSAQVTSHSVVVSGLVANTRYNYRVRSRDAAGNEQFGSNNSFTTAAASSDSTPPSDPNNLLASAASATQVDLTWNPSTDNTAVTGYKIFRNGSQVGTSASASYHDSNLTPTTAYSYRVSAFDAAGNNSGLSSAANATTLADTTPPSVSISSPRAGTTVSGTTGLTVTVSDDVGVAGVTYQIDGQDLAPEVTTSPYGLNLNTTVFSDGNHSLRAIARDTSWNTRISAAVSITIDNTNPPPSSAPTFIQHVTTATNPDALQSGNPFYISMPNRTGAGNALIIGITYPHAAGRTVTISDDKSNTWVLGATTPSNPTSNQLVSRIYYALNVAGGTQKITVTFDAPLFNFQANVGEFYHVAAVAAADGNSGNSASSAPSVTAGTLTSTASGDLIYFYGFDTHNTGSITGFTAGAGFTLLSADVLLGSVSQYMVQTSPGSITPGVTVTGGSSNSFNGVALALKPGPGGTAPAPGIRIVHVYHAFDDRPGVGLQFPSSGNLLVVNTAFAEGQVNISTISSSPSNAWSKLQHNEGPQMWYAANAATGTGLKITPTMLQYPGVSFVLYDVTGAATSPYDSVAGTPFTWKSNTNNTQLLDLPVITPSVPGELIIAIMNDGEGPTIGMVGEGFVLDTITYGGEVDRDNFDNADGYAHYYSSSTAPVSFGWVMHSSTIPETSLAWAVGFKPAP